MRATLDDATGFALRALDDDDRHRELNLPLMSNSSTSSTGCLKKWQIA
jgi:hypothetical protein